MQKRRCGASVAWLTPCPLALGLRGGLNFQGESVLKEIDLCEAFPTGQWRIDALVVERTPEQDRAS